MLLLFDAYTVHNVNAAPAQWEGKFLSTEKEVKFGNKSESNLFLENHKVLIHFCMKQREDKSWIFFGNTKTRQIVCPVGEMDAIYCLQVCGISNS